MFLNTITSGVRNLTYESWEGMRDTNISTLAPTKGVLTYFPKPVSKKHTNKDLCPILIGCWIPMYPSYLYILFCSFSWFLKGAIKNFLEKVKII